MIANRPEHMHLDKLDRGIVERLARDARISNRAIAGELGVTEGTIRTRIKRLQKEGLIQFTVVTDFRMAGSPNLCMMGIDADPAQVKALATALSEIEEINCVIVMLGRYSLLAMGLFTSIEQLNEVVNDRVRTLPGVRKVHPSISVYNMKYEAGIAKITPRPES
ncbi:Lrp/AsnC family transcriptional regulator [Sphingobium sp. WCS2017Hpa-17]|uniref:Lrp/AsnC family transcriptional regulator n=1 Tax=Sphingobium sp. WCS2017Hpa-17 TaxID=3073638 RepID=UPI0028895F6D|nr:Lrp/AsnC family transcriptional regulator [Sphingobium sp. WCS2017Hpa-17]